MDVLTQKQHITTHLWKDHEILNSAAHSPASAIKDSNHGSLRSKPCDGRNEGNAQSDAKSMIAASDDF
jgi:hypothetical protein